MGEGAAAAACPGGRDYQGDAASPKGSIVNNTKATPLVDQLAGKLARFDAEQLGRLIAETMKRKLVAAASSEVAFDTAFSVKEAASLAGTSTETIRRWCAQHSIGRQIGPTWAVSGQRLKAFLETERGHVELTTSGASDAPRDLQKKRA